MGGRIAAVTWRTRPASLHGHHSQAVEFGQAVNRLLVQAAAEVAEIEGRAVIREGKNGDGIPAGERRADRAAPGRYRLTYLEDRCVAAFRQLDDDGVGPALVAVVAHQSSAQAPRLHPHDGVGARIEGRVLIEDLHADDVFLELIAAAVQRFEDDEAQEALEAADLTKGGARQHAVQLLAFSLLGILLWRRFARASRHRVHPRKSLVRAHRRRLGSSR